MGKIKLIVGICAILVAAVAIFFVARSHHAVVLHPKGTIARSELRLITTNVLLMLSICLPTLIALLIVAWKFRANNSKARYNPEHSPRSLGTWMMWTIPSIIVFIMAIITWKATHQLDPYKPLEGTVAPLKIQVVALDWKWLFIYPEQEIATLNTVYFPIHTPIHFALSADGSPMNSFWIPQLSGQIYSMTGMVTPLHLMADEPGEYAGKAAEINGKGYAKMHFVAHATSQSDFEEWVARIKQSPLSLSEEVYDALVKPSTDNPILHYSHVEKGLFDKIVMKYMEPMTH